ncbi:MAG: molybdopterin molybdotransferase MoeA [Bacteroidota bacterium]|nr:molybdopterin molybdotransferase MoeA [Bacteroidota bacterium]
MISVKEAKQKIEEKVGLLQPQVLPLQQMAGLTLSGDVYAKFDIPAFAQSSMDGYAIQFKEKDLPLRIQNKIAAGDGNSYFLSPGHASRIFTGAALPANADTVVMQEKVIIEDGNIVIKAADLKKGDHVREKGAEIKSAEIALEADTVITPAALGFLAAIGVAEASVYPTPVISIIITGNELQPPGNELLFGQVYESNSVSLATALREAGIDNLDIIYAEDEPEVVTSALNNALTKSDLILLTGGISVGDYDFVLQATVKCGVEKHFHKIKQKPGKPLFFGTKENKVVFGLPGNPGSVLTCFYEYVLPAVEKMTGRGNSIKKIKATLQNTYSKKAGLTHFLKGFYENGNVTILPSQASFQLRSFAKANCLIVFDEETEVVKESDEVEVHLLPV